MQTPAQRLYARCNVDAICQRMIYAIEADEMFSLRDWTREELRTLADLAGKQGWRTARKVAHKAISQL